MRQYRATAFLVEVHSWSDVPRGTPLFESLLVFENPSTRWTGPCPQGLAAGCASATWR